MKNKDGTSSIYDNRRSTLHRNNTFHEQLISWSTSEENGSNSTNFEFNAITGGWEYEKLDLSLLDFLSFSFMQVDWGRGFGFSISASVYSPSVSFDVNDEYSVTVSMDLGVDIGTPISFSENFFGFDLDGVNVKIQRVK